MKYHYSVLFLIGITLFSQDTKKAESYFQKGRLYYNMHTIESYERAQREYENAIKADQSYARAYAGLAETLTLIAVDLEKNGKSAATHYSNAKKNAETGLRIDSNIAITHRAFAQVLYNTDSKKFGQEIHDQLLKAISLDSNDAESYYLLWLHTENDKPESLLIRMALRLDSTSFQAHYARGVCYAKLKKFDPAILEYFACIKINPNNYRGFFSLGNAYSQQGKFDLAYPEYEKVIQLNPDLEDTYFYCGVAYSKTQKNKEAKKKFEKYLGLAPSGTYATQARAMLLEVK